MGPSTNDHDADIVALLTAHQSALRLYVHSLLPGDPAAADVTQQANSTIWKKRADFTPGTHFKAWIFSIARFEVLNHRRRLTRERSRFVFCEQLEDLIEAELPHQESAMEERQGALQHCLGKLRSKDRNLIHHRYVHRTPLGEYARDVGRSVGGLKVTLHRIRTALAQCINHQLARETEG